MRFEPKPDIKLIIINSQTSTPESIMVGPKHVIFYYGRVSGLLGPIGNTIG